MANSRPIICLKLGSQTICLAEFIAPRQGGLVLRNYAFREVLIDPADESLDQGELAALLITASERALKLDWFFQSSCGRF